MKKMIVICLVLSCAAAVFAQRNENGVITELTGTVELKAQGRNNFVPAKTGDTVAKDTIISTGFRSTALIRAGSTVLTVRPLTRLSLSEISRIENREELNVNLQTGRVRADVKPPAGTRAIMSIQSPIATASVRGTSFEFDTQAIIVYEGTVVFQGKSGKPMLVNAGLVSEIKSDSSSSDPSASFDDALYPPPPAGYDSGFRKEKAQAPSGGFGMRFNLK